ncbi:LytR/AlgR family response regulator transcription factor [Paenibacillus zanthoxyli]|uniref:LytR/AlgR family response regulator transcription factor n=1 Tax=Paenibacillus zanthoxyli TaxID=369399 RepID=UPI002FBE74D7
MMKTNLEFAIECFTSGEKLLQRYKERSNNPFHILILDIEMSGINGLDVAKTIRKNLDHDVQVMFFSHYPKYILDSFDVQAFHYLLKPVSYELFARKMFSLYDYILTISNQHLVIRIHHEDLVLKCRDIVSIEKCKCPSMKNQMKIVTVYDSFITKGILSSYCNRLDHKQFIAIHRSVIVNLDHIKKFTSSSVLMSNDAEFPIGRSKIKEVKDFYTKLMVLEHKVHG